MSWMSHFKRAMVLGSLVTSALVIVLAASQDKLIYIKRTYESHGLRQYYHKVKTGFEDRSHRVLLEVTYPTSFGNQTAFWIPPKGDSIRAQTFEKLWIVFGGNAQLALDWLWAIERLGEQFQKDSFLLMDYPGYGKCQGTTQGSFTTTESVHIAAEKVIEMLYVNRTDTRPDVGILAHSLGCAAGLQYAASSRYPVSHMVLVSPFASIPKMAAQLFFPAPLDHSQIAEVITEALVAPRNRWDNLRTMDELALRLRNEQSSLQMIIIHGDEDEVCPFNQGQGIYERARRYDPLIKAQFIAIKGGDHNGIIETAFPKIQKALKAKL